jgi:predicted Zn finger-like uncharacterized protein
MLLTTCPNCGAKFKVAPEQLNVRQGRVMCGRCRHVFNAFEALKRTEEADAGELIDYSVVDSKPSPAQFTPESAAASQAPSPQLPPDLPDVSDAQRVDAATVSDSSDSQLPVEPTAETAAPVADLRETEAFDSYEDALRKLEQAEQIAPPVDELYAATSAAVVAAAVSRDALPASGAELLPVEATFSNDERPPLQAPAADTPSGGVAVTNNPLIGGALAHESPPSRVWPWLATIAGMVLLLQAIYFFRSQIVQQYPQLRPSLAAACELIGCTVSWGRDQTLIKIESSDLIEPPGRPGKILLTATLANRAATKQDYPVLEVKLTDANNAVLTSRMLMPAEYLGRTPVGEEGLAPNAELYINLNLELVGKSPASGYGLRAFYP